MRPCRACGDDMMAAPGEAYDVHPWCDPAVVVPTVAEACTVLLALDDGAELDAAIAYGDVRQWLLDRGAPAPGVAEVARAIWRRGGRPISDRGCHVRWQGVRFA